MRDYKNLISWISRINLEKIEIILVLDQESQLDKNLINQLREKFMSSNLDVLHGDRAGPGSARNIGIEKTSGTWTMFCDSDDLPHLENVLNALENSDATNFDIIIGNYEIDDTSRNNLSSLFTLNTELTLIEMIALNPGIWRICFRSDSITSLRFPNIYMAEDQVFIAEYFCTPRRILHAQSLFYTYRKGIETQLTNSKIRQQDIYIAIKRLVALLPTSKNQEFSRLQLIRVIDTGLVKGTLITKMKIIKVVLDLFLVRRYFNFIDILQINYLIWKNKIG